MFTPELMSMLLLLFGLALLISAVGFYRTVYFISIGYAFAITAMSLAVLLLVRQNLTVATALQSLGLGVWSLRLGLYVLRREAQPSYKKELEAVFQRTAGMKLVVKVLIWVSVSLLYVAMFSPALFSLSATAAPTGLGAGVQWVGLLILFGGIGLEALADKQKSDFKAQFPRRFCDVGVYRWVRCPNYLGEILVWIGNWVAGLAFYTAVGLWVVSLIGVVCIVLIMIGSTKRLEEKQDERYGSLPDYQAYIRAVPVLFPFVPVYSLKKVRVYLE